MITLYRPGQRFPAVSVTGKNCDLMCAHCQGIFLDHMKDASSPEKLFSEASELADAEGIGMLISGGCDASGKVPLAGFYDILAKIKNEFDLILNVHTGLADQDEIPALKNAGVDIVSIDIIGSAEAAGRVYGLDTAPWDYEALLARLEGAGMNYVPHVTIGLDSGGGSGETEAIDMISGFNPKMMVFNGLMQTPGLDGSAGVGQAHFSKVLEYGTEKLSSSMKIGVGCMRPRNLEIPYDLIISGQIDAIAMPSRRLKTMLANNKINYLEKDGCCALASLE